MKKLDIFIIEDKLKRFNNFDLYNINNNSVIIKINIFKLGNYELNKELNKIDNTLKIYPEVKRVNIIFDNKIVKEKTNKILCILNNLLFVFYPINRKIKLYSVELESKILMENLFLYKYIVLLPDKTPDSYLEWIIRNKPINYDIETINLSKSSLFPLTKAVGLGSKYDSYFVHIKPQIEKTSNKDLYLIGKAITYDSGGLNLKDESMVDMKTDMAGSSLILTVLKIITELKLNLNLNINLLFPIAENMIGPNSIKPGSVIKSMNNKLIEITNTDAEGRLCLTDAIEYINLNLIKNKENSLIIDIATLTGNTYSITNGISSIIISNKKGEEYCKKMIEIGEEVGEYLDELKLRDEYKDLLKSNVADIQNLNLKERSGCILAGQYLNYFVDPEIRWLHLDIASSTIKKGCAKSYGINLLYEFIKRL